MAAIVWKSICSAVPVVTTNATPVELFRIPLPKGSQLYLRDFTIIAQDLSAQERAVFKYTGVSTISRSRAPTLATVGDVSSPFAASLPAAVSSDPASLGYSYAVTYDADFIIFTVTGAASATINWTGFCEYALVFASIFIPTDLSIVKDWWRADMGVTLGSGNDIATWTSQASAGTVMSSVRAGVNYPQYVASGVNGKPHISFDGSNGVQTSALTLNQPGAVFIVAKAASATHYLMDGRTTNRWQSIVYATGQVEFNAGTSILTAVGSWPNAVATVWEFDPNGTSSAIYKNGTSVATTANAGTGAADGLTFAISKDIASFPMTGSIQEIIRCDAVPSATERTALVNYLRARWAI